MMLSVKRVKIINFQTQFSTETTTQKPKLIV